MKFVIPVIFSILKCNPLKGLYNSASLWDMALYKLGAVKIIQI